MDERILRIFQAELLTQCKFVLMGARLIQPGLDQQDTDAVWFGLQSVLISASNASKLLWGAGRTDEEVANLHEARRPLRESVRITDDSPLNSRRVRNSFEHFDERLDEWFSGSDTHIYVGRNIGPPNLGGIIVGGKQAELTHFGHFDPATLIVTFWDRSAELSPIIGEANRILGILQDLRLRPPARRS